MVQNFYRLFLVFIIVLYLVLFQPTLVWACTCIPSGLPPIAFVEADAVFAGVATDVVNPSKMPNYDKIIWRYYDFVPPLPNFNYHEFYHQVVTFKVADSWKGVEKTYVTVLTGSGSAQCGFAFVQGKQYLVYAYEQNGSLRTHICTRTAEISEATEDLDYYQTIPRIKLIPTLSPRIIIISFVVVTIILLTAAWGHSKKLRKLA